MKKIQKNAARFDNLKQDFLDDKKYSGTAEATLNGGWYNKKIVADTSTTPKKFLTVIGCLQSSRPYCFPAAYSYCFAADSYIHLNFSASSCGARIFTS